ncbi:inositol phosphate kinase 2 isoform X2 [Ptiloglossa arizonensis]|uniref:inositol phosphate kinase 2 isoform X2 n=1 Tax=Ptiloglossa arizonensis TaxID=3350558 RepID=UPI003FA00C31
MTTLDSQADKTLCHLDKVSSTELAEISSDCGIHDELSPLENQVAGHPFDDKRRTIGMLRRPDGRVLKPVVKPLLGKREIAFYESLQASQDPVMLQLKNYVPKYYGTTELQIFGKRVTFLTLKDIIHGMAEPCVMDIKIGKRTWDPLATPQKRATEELKYAESKRTYGFCITGFQVYCLSSGQLEKFGKHYGKTLDAKGVVEGSHLWTIQKNEFQGRNSLLVAYDAKRLRHYLRLNKTGTDRSTSHVAKSFSTLNNHAAVSNVFKDVRDAASNTVPTTIAETNRNRTMERVHFIKRSISLSSECDSAGKEKTLNRSGSCSPDFRVDRLCRTHSYVNNFDDDIIRMKEDYDALLSELSSSSEEKQNWVRINMIDFTHVFPTEDPSSLDLNYLEGIENLIKLVEMFLVSKDNAA